MANQYMQEEDDAILKTYNRYPVVLDHGDGAYLYDPEGKKYLDFSAGYAVSSLGYNNKEFNDALKAQIDKMIHTSNLYYNTTCGKAGEDLKKITGMYKVFQCPIVIPVKDYTDLCFINSSRNHITQFFQFFT